MADSDNSTTLPFVTPGRKREPFGGDKTPPYTRDFHEADPGVGVANAWKAAARRTSALCRRQQSLEARLARAIGFPPSLSETPASLASDPDATCNAPAPTHLVRWQARDAEIGYSRALEAERAAAEEQHKILDQLAATHATSIAGVVAKLEVILLEGKERDDDPEFPWPHMRSVLNDIKRLSESDPEASSTIKNASNSDAS